MEKNPDNNDIAEVYDPKEAAGGRNINFGDETWFLMEYLKKVKKIDEDSEKVLLKEARSILSKCPAPTEKVAKETGLVIGYVQSGKTMSFTTVTALARDNAYQIVIIIAGTSIPLFNQSTTRIQEDLQLNDRPDRKWLLFQNPQVKNQDHISMTSILRDWIDKSVPDRERQTILITVMKNHTHLHNLINVMQEMNLEGIPTLIIDDEADQAGLNTLVKKGDESTTYHQLTSLRKCFPHHAFLQYTATPQAPLLINIIDILSPNFVDVLTPGEGYVGGKDFFLTNPSLVRVIPDSHLPTSGRPLSEPPSSLIEAMKVFFLGVASGLVTTGGEKNRSMLIHPSQKTIKHTNYFYWVTQIKDSWEKTLELPEEDIDRKDLIGDFKESYLDLKSTVSDIPPFDQLEERLKHAIRRTKALKVNAALGKTPPVNWKATYAHILVGGQAMDRGFTIEGLTVTYMPRDIGVANADTIQQRARFFGYKRRYLGYCRVYLESNAKEAYRLYVSHEEDIRSQLITIHNKPLNNWKREFFLTRQLKPTRDSVLDLDYSRGGFSDDWFAPKVPHDSLEAVQDNTLVINDFINGVIFSPDSGHPDRTEFQEHSINDQMSLDKVYEQLLIKLRVTNPIDSKSYTGVLLQIRKFLEKSPTEKCAIYLISKSKDIWHKREFTLNQDNEIPNFFAGEYPVMPKDKRGSIYPGDRAIVKENTLTIQIRKLAIKDGTGNIILDNFPVITVWIPAKMGNDWLIQNHSKKG